MSDRPVPLTEATPGERNLSITLMTMAAGMLAAIATVAITVLPSLSTASRGGVLLIAGAIGAVLFFSMIFGGRGIAYGPGRSGLLDRFNVQASLGALALVLLVPLGLLILNGQSPTDSEALNDRLTAIETRLEALETNTPEAVDAMSGQLEDLTEQIAEIEERMTTPPESEPAVSDNE